MNNDDKNNTNNNQELNNLYNTSYDPNRDFTAGSFSDNNQQSFKILMGSTNDIREQKPDNSEVLLEEYIGKNSKKIINGKFNICAFLFTAFYLFYRKLFGLGILLSIVIGGLSYLTVPYIIYPIISLICGFGFNIFYVMYAKHRIKKIEYNHPDASIEQLTGYVQNEGGTSGDLVVKGIFLEIFLGILTIAILITFGVGTTWNKLLSNFDFKEILNIFKKKETKQKQFDGFYTTDEKINFKDYFTFKVPDGYKEIKNNKYQYDRDDSDCEISFSNVIDYQASDILINSMQKFYKKDLSTPSNANFGYYASDVEIKQYNKINWEGFNMKWAMGHTYFYATDYKDKVFMIELKNGSYTDVCNNHIYELLQTINTK